MGSPEIKVLIDEISKLRSEIIEMKIEIEGLKADIAAIGSINKEVSELKVASNGEDISTNKFTIIKNKPATIKVNKVTNENKILDENLKTGKKVDKNLEKKADNQIKQSVKSNEIRNNIQEIEVKIDRKDKKIFKDKLKHIMNSEVRYETWLRIGVDNLAKTKSGVYTFPTANDFTRGIVELRYKDMVFNVLQEVFKDVTDIKITVI
ncbi:MAG: hypothetical protein ACRC41_17145 [Sarcina sp.]